MHAYVFSVLLHYLVTSSQLIGDSCSNWVVPLTGLITTGTDCRHSVKLRKHSVKYLPSVTLDKLAQVLMFVCRIIYIKESINLMFIS
jgi:hypothetical protein